MHVLLLLLLLLDTVPGDIDIGDYDSDTASQEATPTSSVHLLQSMQLYFFLEVRGGKWRRDTDEHVSLFYPSFYL